MARWSTSATYRRQFPKIPSVDVAQSCYQPLRLDLGSRWHTEGIADHVPPQQGTPYRTLVPAVDADGNELAGIRLPEVAVPLATYMGWNLRDEAHGAGGMLAGLHGKLARILRTSLTQTTHDHRSSSVIPIAKSIFPSTLMPSWI